jgi:hypothetical protein
MSEYCATLHRWFNARERLSFPFSRERIPPNGIYLLFEKGEQAHVGDRIVRIGTHTGHNQLLSRLQQHFLRENKDRSIFRKNIGRALLARANDPFLPMWELDLTSQEARAAHGHKVDRAKQLSIEQGVSACIRDNFTVVVFPVAAQVDRLRLESRLISTISLCEACQPSTAWLGHFSAKSRIRESGLWQVNELYKDPLSADELAMLREGLGY